MRIILAHNFYQQAGGEDSVFAAEVALLREFGHDVVEYKVHNDDVNAMGKLRLIASTVYNRAKRKELQQIVRDHRAQVVHFHNTFPLISPAGYYAAHAAGAAVVQTLHNFRLLCANAIFFREGKACEECLGKSILWPAIAHKCYRDSRAASTVVATMLTTHRVLGTYQNAVDAYIPLTANSRDKFLKGGLPESKIFVKPNFVHPDPRPGAGDGNYAIFVGRLSHEKGLSTLLRAWNDVSNLTLKIVGDGPLADEVRDAMKTNPRIEWLGKKPINEVCDLIGHATMLVLPSETYENFPRVAAEAFSKGTPVIGANHGAMADIIEPGKTGLLFATADANDLAAKVRQALANPGALATMRTNARAEYEAKYTGEANHKQLIAIYTQAIENFHGASGMVIEPAHPRPTAEAHVEDSDIEAQATSTLVPLTISDEMKHKRPARLKPTGTHS